MPELTLYYKTTCPFCVKVLKFMEENNIKIDMKDIDADSETRNEFSQKTNGKTQVPCLFIDGTPMWESDDIIQWMKDNL